MPMPLTETIEQLQLEMALDPKEHLIQCFLHLHDEELIRWDGDGTFEEELRGMEYDELVTPFVLTLYEILSPEIVLTAYIELRTLLGEERE